MAKLVLQQRSLTNVRIFQSRSLARIELIIKGDVELTTPKIKELVQLLTNNEAGENKEKTD